MPYQGAAFLFVLGVGIAVAALMYLVREEVRLEQPHGNTGYRPSDDNDIQRNGWQRPNDTSNSSQRRRRRRQSNSSESMPKCTVCIEYMSENGNPCKKLRCGHGFHAACIDRWAMTKRECPVCRYGF